MKKTRTRIHEDMLISRQRIKSEDSSLKVENTAEDLKASISCIESNKLEQETREGYNLIDISNLKNGTYHGVELINNDGLITLNGIPITSGSDSFGRITFDKNKLTTLNGYYTLVVEISSGIIESGGVGVSFRDEEGNQLGYIQTSLTQKIVSKSFNIDNIKNIEFFASQNANFNNCQLRVMLLEGNYTAETIPEYEQFGQSPSTKYKSEVLGVTGDVKLKVQTKNIAQNIQYSNPTQQYRPTVITNYKLKKRKYYIFSCDTENTGEKIYLNVGEGYGIRYIQTWDKMHKICDGTRKYWIVKASDSALHVNRPTINKSSVGDGTTNGVHTGFTYNFMIEEIKATTDEEALKYVSSKYVEHKEQNFTISLGNKTLYKGDKIIKKNGKWYFSLKWKIINDFSNLVKESTSDGMHRARVPLDNKIVDKSHIYLNKSYSNVLKCLADGQTYSKVEGFTISTVSSNTSPQLFMYIKGFENYTAEEYKQVLNDLNTYFIVPLKEEELELIEGEILIKQLDKILLNIYEYDDETNFDFDQDVTFEIEVEKDNIRLLNSRLDEIEKQSLTTSALALESEV